MSERVTGLGPGSEVTDVAKGALLPVAASDLVAWYPFRSGTGEDITAGDSRFGDSTDYSATVNGATFKPSGGVTDIQTGANSGAFEFDGTDDTLDLGTVADSDQSLTFMTWVKPDKVTRDNMRILTKIVGGTKSNDGGLILLLQRGGDELALDIINNGSDNFARDVASISANTYVHVAARYNFQTGDATLLRNGQSVASTSPGQVPAFSSGVWAVGDDSTETRSKLDGTVDGTRIYTTALSDSQINQIYLNTEP